MRSSIIYTLIILFFTNCISEFDFVRPDSIKGAISIQGKLVKGAPSTVSVTLRDVFDFFNSADFLTAGKVLIIDEAGNELQLKTRQQGLFTLEIPEDHPFFKVDYGKQYKIRVENLKSQVFESDFDELLPVPVPDALIAKPVTVEYVNEFGSISAVDQLNFYISTPLKAENQRANSRILWELNGVSKVTDTPKANGCLTALGRQPKSCYLSLSPI